MCRISSNQRGNYMSNHQFPKVTPLQEIEYGKRESFFKREKHYHNWSSTYSESTISDNITDEVREKLCGQVKNPKETSYGKEATNPQQPQESTRKKSSSKWLWWVGAATTALLIGGCWTQRDKLKLW